MVYLSRFAKKCKNAVFVHVYKYSHFFYKDGQRVFIPVIIHYKDIIYSLLLRLHFAFPI